jgi:large subunit ribosomal protein L17
MRHKRTGRKLGVVTKHRRAMFRNMATDLFRHEKITTTDARAKEIRRVAEKIITLAKKGTLQSRRQAAAFIKDKDVLKKLFDEIAEKYKDRPGGYTRIIKMGYRKGDNAALSLIEIVQEEYKPKKKKKKPVKTATKQHTDSPKKSTKKESAEELGLIEEGGKAAVAAEAALNEPNEIVEETLSEEITAKEESEQVSEATNTEEIIAEDTVEQAPEASDTEEIKPDGIKVEEKAEAAEAKTSENTTDTPVEEKKEEKMEVEAKKETTDDEVDKAEETSPDEPEMKEEKAEDVIEEVKDEPDKEEENKADNSEIPEDSPENEEDSKE